jgi:hypothetical protein
MKKILFPILLFLIFSNAHGQYWFGPKVGVHVVNHRYQLAGFKSDSFNVSPDIRYQFGAVLTYTASDRYSVHTEINFERIGRTLQNFENKTPTVFSKTKFSFISIPLIMRVNFGRSPVSYYLNGGPKISFWMGGSGKLRDLDEFVEAFGEDFTLEYDVTFNENNESLTEKPILEANRLQYALTLGGGFNFDIRGGARIMLDFRYSFGHSNMGFNDNPAYRYDASDYEENFEYTHDMISVSVAYLFEYNAQLKRKGGSTNKLSNKKKK